MTDYQCQTCKVITTVEGDEWFKVLSAHRNAHMGTKWGPSYEFCRFAYWHPRCIRTNCDEIGTHETAFGEFGGAAFCDKHWNEHQNDPKAQALFGRVR